MFDEHQGEIYDVPSPNATERLSYFQQLFCKNSHMNNKPDNISNRSSYGLIFCFDIKLITLCFCFCFCFNLIFIYSVDFIQIMAPRKNKNEQQKQHKEVEKIDAPVTRRTRLRTKLSVVNSSVSTTDTSKLIFF